MSQEIKRSERRRIRPASAKVSSELRQRTSSAKSHKLSGSQCARLDTKVDSVLLYKTTRYSGQGIGLNLGDEDLQKLRPSKVPKSKEVLYDENMHLKQTMNNMSAELRTLKTKMQRNRRRNLKFTSKLDMEFEKNIYWPSTPGSYMVMGVKNQYEKLKEENKELQRELDCARRAPKYTCLQEKMVELERMQEENIRLKQQLDKLIRIYKIPQNIHEANKDNAAAKEILIEQMKKEVAKYKSDITSYEEGLKTLNRMLKQRDIKIEFLQKRIIEKENSNFTLQTKAGKLGQDAQHFKQQFNQLKAEAQEKDLDYQQRLSDMRELEKRRTQEEIKIYQTELHKKESYIERLEKEVGYLSALLKECRPLKQSEPQHIEQPPVQIKEPTQKRQTPNLQLQIVRKKSFHATPQDGQEARTAQANLIIMSDEQSPSAKTGQHYSLRRNKVRPEDVKDICLEVKYRLINRNTDIIAAKNLLVGDSQGQISIRQIIDVLQQEPFAISDQNKSTLLARYLVEDSDQPIVYYKEQRSASATIVRSVLQQIIPKYSVWTQEELGKIKERVVEVRKVSTQMLRQYFKSLSQVVSQTNKQLTLSCSKFVEVLNQLELSSSPELTDFMIMHMLEGSAGLNALSLKKLQELVS